MARYYLRTLRYRAKRPGAGMKISLWIEACSIASAVVQARSISLTTLGSNGGKLPLTDEQGSMVWTFQQDDGILPRA